MSKLAKRNKDPSNQKGNIRTALAVTVALALGGAALASRDSEPKEPKITFESNIQALARLAALVGVYGDNMNVSKDEKRNINAVIEGSVPVFKEDVAQKARQIMAADPSGKPKNAKIVENGVTRAYHATHRVGATNGEEEFRITTFREVAGSTTEQNLTVTQGPNGTQVYFSSEENLPSIPGLSAATSKVILDINEGNELTITHDRDSDANPATYEHGSGGPTRYTFDGGRLNAGVMGFGNGVEAIANVFTQAYVMLNESAGALVTSATPS